jgi:hypothetical protein
MKLSTRPTVIVVLLFAISLWAVTLTSDPLTGLPLYPATDSRLHLGNEPTKIPDMQICKSKMHANLYAVFDSKLADSVAWYTAHLPGFHKTHAYIDNRSQDKFYNDAGTEVVSVLGEVGKDGENVGTHTVTYYLFQPGLSSRTIITFGQHKMACQ